MDFGQYSSSILSNDRKNVKMEYSENGAKRHYRWKGACESATYATIWKNDFVILHGSFNATPSQLKNHDYSVLSIWKMLFWCDPWVGRLSWVYIFSCIKVEMSIISQVWISHELE